MKGPAPPALDRSRSAEADRHLAAFDDHRNLALVAGDGEHFFKPLRIAQHVDIFEGDFASRVVLTGTPSVLSEVLPEDQNFFRHRAAPCSQLTAANGKLQASSAMCYLQTRRERGI